MRVPSARSDNASHSLSGEIAGRLRGWRVIRRGTANARGTLTHGGFDQRAEGPGFDLAGGWFIEVEDIAEDDHGFGAEDQGEGGTKVAVTGWREFIARRRKGGLDKRDSAVLAHGHFPL